MKRIVSSFVVALMGIGISATSHATAVTFGDNNRFWGDTETGSNWSGKKWNTDNPNPGWNGNVIDVIGDPDVSGGTANFNGGKLQSVVFNYTDPLHNWSMLAPGNLFINVLSSPNDTTWDYVVATMGDAKTGKADGSVQSLAAGDYALYDVTALGIDARRGADNSAYVLSGLDNTGYWAGYYLRNNHPIGLSDDTTRSLTAAGSVHYSGFPGTLVGNMWAGQSTFTFAGTGLDLSGKDIIIGWEMTCANDVVYEKIANPVPEPASMLLLGTGLLGLAGLNRRKNKA